MEEQVLVVPTTLFHEIGYFQGFCCNDVERYRRVLLAPENVLFRPRSEMEKDPNFKQLIPYMIFCHTGSDGIIRLFQYVRGKGMGESRLHSKRSVGVGGHLSLDDRNESVQNHDFYREGMLRELREEVVLGSEFTEHCVGLINDDESEVGRVHLGIVHCFDLTEPNVISNEPDLIESGFVPVREMLRDLSVFESWSSICIEALYGKETPQQ
ncbi:MAG: phosphoesterase [Planctomycetaceae bacterium]|jgi:predicted NUDIX family phosphoesterase|nr:phosphoesterase [Planctomycetaceae bacterium]